MKKKLLLGMSSLALISVLAACNETKETEEDVHATHTHAEHAAYENTAKGTAVEEEKGGEPTGETGDVTKEVTQDAPAVQDSQTKLNSPQEALAFMENETPEGESEDALFSVSMEIEQDEKGSFYSVKLASRSMQEAGGTGTVGFYKVYVDGTYELKE